VTAGLDTSVVVRLLVGEPRAQAAAARNFLEQRASAGEGPSRVSDLVVSEVFFALIHHYAVPAAEAVRAMNALFEDERVAPSPLARAVLALPGVATGKPGLVDRLIHGQYAAEGAALATFDKAAGRLPGAQLL
jgi:predicted nucleic acid-binding protein